MFIENVSFIDIINGHHIDVRPGKSLLIQIVDGGLEFPTPKKHFDRIEQFVFYDVEDNDPLYLEGGFTKQQAAKMAAVLVEARDNDLDVIVHCVAGVSRSGAVVEVATMIGFPDPGTYRIPNATIKTMLMRELGLTPSFDDATPTQCNE